MSIRREDKELIHNLAVLGAILGACLGAFGVGHLSNKAHEKDRQLTEYQQTHAALAKLGADADEEGPAKLPVDQELIRQMQAQIQAEKPEADGTVKSFWLRLPRWGFWGICAGMGVAGAVAGFSTIWLTGWIGSIFVYYFIRGLYKSIRKVAPNSTVARSLVQPQPQGCVQATVQRSDSRILPMVVKLLFLLTLVLAVLGIVVWHLAGI